MARFVKGQSGNPSGRPKDEAQIGQLARTHSREAIDRLVTWMRSDNSRASIAACVAILERAFGKPHQSVDLTNSDGSFAQALADAAELAVGAEYSEPDSEAVTH